MHCYADIPTYESYIRLENSAKTSENRGKEYLKEFDS